MNEVFEKWKKSQDNIAKLQWVYAALAIFLIVVAGLVALLNADASDSVMNVVSVVFTVFVVNLVTWSLVGPKLTAKRNTRK